MALTIHVLRDKDLNEDDRIREEKWDVGGWEDACARMMERKEQDRERKTQKEESHADQEKEDTEGGKGSKMSEKGKQENELTYK